MFNFLFNPNGRVSRKGYWLGLILPAFGLYILILTCFFMLLEHGSIGGLTWTTEAQVESIILNTAQFWLLPATVISLALSWISIAVGFKRLHDRNLTGWWMFAPSIIGFVAMVPFGLLAATEEAGIFTVVGLVGFVTIYLVATIISIWLFIVMCFLPGTPGPNKFGPDPLKRENNFERDSFENEIPPWAERT